MPDLNASGFFQQTAPSLWAVLQLHHTCLLSCAAVCLLYVCWSQAFFAQIYSEAQSSRAAPGHVAIAELHRMGRLQRHYTLNIDGLAAVSPPQQLGLESRRPPALIRHAAFNPSGNRAVNTCGSHEGVTCICCPSREQNAPQQCGASSSKQGLGCLAPKGCLWLVCCLCRRSAWTPGTTSTTQKAALLRCTATSGQRFSQLQQQ